jgi:hypothetical protein
MKCPLSGVKRTLTNRAADQSPFMSERPSGPRTTSAKAQARQFVSSNETTSDFFKFSYHARGNLIFDSSEFPSRM